MALEQYNILVLEICTHQKRKILHLYKIAPGISSSLIYKNILKNGRSIENVH